MPIQQKVKRRKTTNYLNNKDFLNETIKSIKQDKITDQLAQMFMKLVARYGKKGNFANYTYNSDMQAYALMMLVKTWKAFNPERSQNAFAFFTQCVKHSFIQFLNTERRQRDIRDEMLVTNGLAPSHTYTIAQKEMLEAREADDEENQSNDKNVENTSYSDDSMLVY